MTRQIIVPDHPAPATRLIPAIRQAEDTAKARAIEDLAVAALGDQTVPRRRRNHGSKLVGRVTILGRAAGQPIAIVVPVQQATEGHLTHGVGTVRPARPLARTGQRRED